MSDGRPKLPALAPEPVERRIAAVLGPGDAVLWQAAMGPRHSSFLGIGGSGALLAAALQAGWLAVDRGMVDLALPAFGDAPLAWLLASLVVVAILTLSPMNSRSAWDYALTDRRILVLRKGRVWQQATLDDPWGKILGVKPDSVEDAVDIAGFRGFAVVRNLPRGGSLTGFGTVAVPVMTRQWWLGGHGLVIEIQGIAPLDSEVLQESVDMTVNSIRLP